MTDHQPKLPAPEWVAPLVRAFIDGMQEQNERTHYADQMHLYLCVLNGAHNAYELLNPEAANEL